ncbi:MAG: hypothetical protein KDC38_20750, partial [Planctomycetes bacterium]|nr:hypothetical protein [Planctomycetota bacterium]
MAPLALAIALAVLNGSRDLARIDEPTALAALERIVDASGGRVALERAANARTTYRIANGAGSMVVITRRDGARRVELRLGGQVQILIADGAEAWVSTLTGEWLPMPSTVRSAFELDRIVGQILLDHRALGWVARCSPPATEKATDAMRVRFVPRARDRVPPMIEFGIDRSSGLLTEL